MTDDEVEQWLTDKEREDWGSLPNCACSVLTHLRSLAETRKALWRCEPVAYRKSDETCILCDTSSGHEPDCIFATMPRPR